MSTARSIFLERLGVFKLAVNDAVLLDKSPTEVLHNARARVLRNGMSVVGFAMLEEFLRSRFSEICEKIGGGPIGFGGLPKGLRRISTLGVIDALRFQYGLAQKAQQDPIPLVQKHASHVASTMGTGPYFISPFSFGMDASNLTHDDVKEGLRAIQVVDGWGAIRSVASRTGLGHPSYAQSFINASRRRHASAHAPSANTPSSELDGYCSECMGVAIGFDLIISKCLRMILDGSVAFCTDSYQMDISAVKLRFVDETSVSTWRSIGEGKRRAWKSSSNLKRLLKATLKLAKGRGEAVVVRDRRQTPTEWYTPDVD